jgi:CheY-like chemotaxis protein
MNPGRTVVLIDDDHDDFEIFTMALKEVDPSITCIYYDSGKEALTGLTETQILLPEYVFVDLNMPGMNGIQFLESLNETDASHLKVIVYSTSILPLHKEKIKSLGVHHSFVKPFSHLELIKILKSILD